MTANLLRYDSATFALEEATTLPATVTLPDGTDSFTYESAFTPPNGLPIVTTDLDVQEVQIGALTFGAPDLFVFGDVIHPDGTTTVLGLGYEETPGITTEITLRIAGADLPPLDSSVDLSTRGQGTAAVTPFAAEDVISLTTAFEAAMPPDGAGDGTGDGDDTLIGTDLDDDISGEAGNDRIEGRDGTDSLNGGPGNDTILGGPGPLDLRDNIDGGAGDDVLDGGFGNDSILGGSGDDSILGAQGIDTLRGEAGNDTIIGGGGPLDILDGGDGNDLLRGGDEADDGIDRIFGGAGNDTIDGGLTLATEYRYGYGDSLYGGEGDDLITSGAGPGQTTVQGGGGNDTLIGGTGPDILAGGAGDDVLRSGGSFDQLFGGIGNDLLEASMDGVFLDGGAGDDTLTGGDGRDRLDGGAGNDSIVGGEGQPDTVLYRDAAFATLTVVHLGGDTVTIDDGRGIDTVSGVEVFALQDGRFTLEQILPEGAATGLLIEGLPLPETLSGGNGDDTITPGPTDSGGDPFDTRGDLIEGRAGNDLITGSDLRDTIVGGTGNDTITGGTTAADLSDLIISGDGNDMVDGGAGNDELRGDGGDDVVSGGTGADTIIGGAGDDTLSGGSLGDLLFGGDGMDFVNGGFGSDRINLGAGADRVFHAGVEGHGSDWVQDFAAEDALVAFDGALASDFQVNIANTAGAGDAGIDEAFVIYQPTGQILWALVDGAALPEITLRIDEVEYALTV
ncbi:calcium-binding protein [Jannaschia sp. 2305UL9-9]|uniref:calcium-binding protein n=1 Tax=Jannaschia sp. 2305UL9-9 TaxID=3121638 RepID=UPI003529A6E2